MRRTFRATVAAGAVTAAVPAFANIGVPMVAVFLPPLWLSLIPVILLEAWVLSKRLQVKLGLSVAGAAIGNLLSALAGVPLMWVVIASLQLAVAGEARGLSTLGARIYAVTVQAPWLIPYEADLKWMIPVALLVLAVPAYLLSVWVEWLSFRPFVPAERRPRALSAVAVANACSYALLAALFAGVLAAGQSMNSLLAVFEPISMGFAEVAFSVTGWLMGQSSQ